MGTQLKDVIHLLLGCECIGQYDDADRRAYLTGITNGGTECELQFFEEDGINVFESPEWSDIEKVRPILRRLASMTEDEMKALWAIVFHRPFPDSGRIEKSYMQDKKNPRWVLMSGVERLGIQLNGDIWADSDLHIWQQNPHLLTVYLLKQGFDLFGLIDSGQAIDKNQGS